MGNPMLQNLNKSASRPTMSNNPVQLMQQFTQFKREMQGKNPQAIVEDLVKSGKMTPQQRDNLMQQAQALSRFLK